MALIPFDRDDDDMDEPSTLILLFLGGLSAVMFGLAMLIRYGWHG